MTAASYDTDQARRYFRAIYGDQCGYAELATIEGDPDDPQHTWRREWFYYTPARIEELIERCVDLDQTFGNLYTSTMLYSTAARTVTGILPGRAIFVDDATEEDSAYTYVVQTSPGSRQAWLIADRLLSWENNKAIRTAAQADKSGKADYKVARVPGISTNTKRTAGGQYTEPLGNPCAKWIKGTGYRAHTRRGSRRLYTVEELRERYRPAEPTERTTIALDWPEPSIAFWLSNLDALTNADGLPWIATSQTTQFYLAYHGKIDELIARCPWLAEDLLKGGDDVNRSMLRCVIAQGLRFCRLPFPIFAAFCWRYFDADARRAGRGSKWLEEEIARLWAEKTRPHRDGEMTEQEVIDRRLTKAPIQAAQPIPAIVVSPKGRPATMDASGYYAWLNANTDGDGIKMGSQGTIAELLGRGVATIRRWERVLKDEGKIERRTFAHRHDSYLVILGAIRNTAFVSDAPADAVLSQPIADRVPMPESEPEAVQRDTRRPLDHLSTGPVTPGELRRWCADAFDRLADAGARLTFGRVRKYVLADAGDRPFDVEALREIYGAERKQRQRDRDWRRLLASLPTMKAKKFSALSARVDRILVGGPAGPEREFYRWAAALLPHIGAEQDRRAGMAERTRPRQGRRRATTVEEDLLLAEIADQRQPPAQRGTTGRRVSLSPASEAPQTIGLFDQPPSEVCPRSADMIARLKQRSAERLSQGREALCK